MYLWILATVFTLNIGTLLLFTIVILNQFHISTRWWMSIKQVDLDQTLHSVTSDLGLHCLLKPVCSNTLGR